MPGRVSISMPRTSLAEMESAYKEEKKEEPIADPEEWWAEEMSLRLLHWSWLRRQAAHLVEMTSFEYIIGFVIVSNCFTIIIETDLRAADVALPDWFAAIQTVYMVIYSVELALRIFAYRIRFFAYKDGTFAWNMMDFVIVGSDLGLAILNHVPGADVQGGGALSSSMRVFRLIRLARFIKVLHYLDVLSQILKALMHSISAIFWAVFVLMIMLTVWGVVAVEVVHPVASRLDFGDCERCPRAYRSVLSSAVTFTKTVIAGDSWGQTSIPVMEDSPITSIVFLGVMISVSFGMLNLMLAIIVKTSEEAQKEDLKTLTQEKELKRRRAKKKLKQICGKLDMDGSGELTLEELLKGLATNREFGMIMRSLDINDDELGLVFGMMDADKSGAVSYNEFVEQLHKMKSQDTNSMLVFMKACLADIRHKLDESLLILRHEVLMEVRDVAVNIRREVHEKVVAPVSATNGHSTIEPLEVLPKEVQDEEGCTYVSHRSEGRGHTTIELPQDVRRIRPTPPKSVLETVDVQQLLLRIEATRDAMERLLLERHQSLAVVSPQRTKKECKTFFCCGPSPARLEKPTPELVEADRFVCPHGTAGSKCAELN